MHHRTFNRESLYNLVWSKPISILAKEFRISASDLRKLCKRYGIPVPVNGHWQKLKYQKKVEVIDLPDGDLDIEIELIKRNKGEEEMPFFKSPIKQRVYELTNDKSLNLIVQTQLKNTHPLVLKTKKKLEELDKIENSSYEIRRKIFEDILPIHTDQKLRNRALRIMNTIVSYVYNQNHTIVFEYDRCYVQMFGQRTEINLRQKNNRIRSTDKNGWTRQDWVKSNNLEFQAGPSFRQKCWIDKENKKVEEYVPNIIAWIEQDCKYYHDLRKEQAEDAKIRAMEEAEAKEKLRLVALEKEKYDNLIKESENWNKANILRGYISAVIENAKKDGILIKEKKEWVKWASRIADSIDPLIK